jgi:hypothetical protein
MFPPLHNIQSGPGAHLIPLGPRDLSREYSGRGVELSIHLQLSDGIYNEWRYTSTSFYSFMARTGKAVMLMITTTPQSTDELQNIVVEWAARLLVILESQTAYLGTRNV